MSPRLTADLLEAFLHCRYKGHLKQAGQMGTRSDHEILTAEQRAVVRQQAIEQITTRHVDGEVISAVPLTTSTLKQGATIVLDAILEDDTFSLRFDGLKKADGPSKLGDYHYVPVLFHGSASVRKEQRLLLDVYGFLLSRMQGRTPGHGIVWRGEECRATKVRLSPDLRKAERLLRDVQQAREAEPPRLILNDHCQVCEFRQRCHQQAVQEDNISLLRGMKETEIKGYSRKGILTLTQLAHTFRPRRRGKRVPRRTNHRYHALQALAVRDKRVYLFGTPELPSAAAKIYFDIEGLPDEGFIYLIGMTVIRGESEEHYSYWADTRDQEKEIFEQFLAQVSQYEDCRVEGRGSMPRLLVDRSGILRCPEHRLAEEMGSRTPRRVEGKTGDVQPGGLCRPP
jgi:predicted RecB family nuclease